MSRADHEALVDAVAKELWLQESLVRARRVRNVTWDDVLPAEQATLRKIAAPVIALIRERLQDPSNKMLLAGYRAYDRSSQLSSALRAMLDASALTPGEG